MSQRRRPPAVLVASNPTGLQRSPQECLAPDCEAQADPDLPIPLCWDCGIRTARALWRRASDIHEQIGNLSPEILKRLAEVEAAANNGRQGLVYFIRFGERIKIGFTTNLEQRLSQLPHDEVLGTVSGTRLDEKRCHEAFKEHRLKGEWFADHEDIRQFIASVTNAA